MDGPIYLIFIKHISRGTFSNAIYEAFKGSNAFSPKQKSKFIE